MYECVIPRAYTFAKNYTGNMFSRPTIVAAVQALQLPVGGYALFGGTVLAMHDLRETGDIDIICTPQIFELLKSMGWDAHDKHGAPFVSFENMEACLDMRHGDFQKTTKDILADADLIDGIPCVSLADTRAFKMALGREKDARDVELIDTLLA